MFALGSISWLSAPALLSSVSEDDSGYWLHEIIHDVEFLLQSVKPDNVPIHILFVMLTVYLTMAFVSMRRNDRIIARLEANPEMAKRHHRKWEPYHHTWPKKLHVWPYLLRIEFVGALVIFFGLMVWSLVLMAPLEEPSNSAFTPNPSKAPWYFLGLQELLVYFDPWIAGVILPFAIVFGLMAIPYIDVNKLGNGYYTWRQRKFAMINFLFGFIVLWVGMVFLGTFMRGPGWQLFMPWEAWDAHKVTHELNVNLHQMWPFSMQDVPLSKSFMERLLAPPTIVGGIATAAIFGVLTAGSWFGFKKFASGTHMQMSTVQRATTHILVASMAFVVLKMVLRLGFHVKYLWVVPGVLNI